MDELNCKIVREAVWEIPARREAGRDYRGYAANSGGQAPQLAAHLSTCRDCKQHYGDVSSLQSGLKNLPIPHAPALLTTRLRVLASRERQRQIQRRDFRTWLTHRISRAHLFFDNLLKPFAVPAAGGILASFLCFGIIVDTLHYAPDWQEDLPIGFTSEIAIDELSPFCFIGQDVMVQLTVDSTGHVTDYSLPQNANPSSQELQEIGNLVLYSTFTPAMRLGRPIASKRIIAINHISVKG